VQAPLPPYSRIATNSTFHQLVYDPAPSPGRCRWHPVITVSANRVEVLDFFSPFGTCQNTALDADYPRKASRKYRCANNLGALEYWLSFYLVHRPP
jgi:hypothetical protein